MTKNGISGWMGRIAKLAVAVGVPSGAVAQTEPLKFRVLHDLGGAFVDLGGKGSIVAAQMAVDDFGGRVLDMPISSHRQ